MTHGNCIITSTRRYASAAALLLLGLSTQTPALAADRSDEPERCVQISRIDSIDILNRSQIVYEMIGGDLYINELPYPCPGLRTSSTIMYRNSIDQLCDVDIITVVDPVGGGLFPRGSCGLGKFYPISKQELEDLKARSEE